MPRFSVIDKHTWKEADPRAITLTEEWAEDLVFVSGFALQDDGTLILTDIYGHYRYCPEKRFEIVWEGEEDG